MTFTRAGFTTSSTRSSRSGSSNATGEGSEGRYRNTAETAAFLDKRSPTYVGGILEMSNARLYGFFLRRGGAAKAGFREVEILPLTGPASAGIAYQ